MRLDIRPLCASVLVLIALAPSGLLAQVPDGFRTHGGDDSGLSFYYPIEFQEIPLPPTETVSRARYVRKTVPDALRRDKVSAKPAFEVFVIPKAKGRTTKSSANTEAPAESRPDGPESRSDPTAADAPRTVREWMI